MKTGINKRVMTLLLYFLCALPAASLAQEISDLKRGVVRVTVTTFDGRGRIGTGFVVHAAEDAVHIVTAAHVIEDASQVEVEFFTRRNRPVSTDIVHAEEGDPRGLAVLLVKGDIPRNLVALEMHRHAAVYPGDSVVTLGFPVGGSPWSVTKGEVVGHHGKAIVFSGPVNEGSSGSPLLREGQVIGVVSQTMQKFSYATPTVIADYVLEAWGIPDTRREVLARILAAESELVQLRSRKPDPLDERYFWPDLMKPMGSDDLLELSVLLAVESIRRSPSPDATKALRAGLGRLDHPVTRIASASAVAFSPDSQHLLTAGGGAARTWDIATAEEKIRFSYGTDIIAAAYSRDARFLGTGSKMGIVSVWEAASGQKVTSIQLGHAVRSIAFAPGGKLLFTISGPLKYGAHEDVQAWDIETGSELWRFSPLLDLQNAIAIDPGGNYLAVRTDNSTGPGFISVREIASGKEVWRTRFEHPVLGIAFSADGKRLAVATQGYCQVWSIAEEQELVRIHGGFSSDAPLAFSPDGQYLAVDSNNRLSIWALLLDQSQQRMLPGDETVQIAHPGTPYAVSFSPDGAYVASTSLWEIATGEEIARLPLPDRKVDVAFSPDGQYLVARSRYNTAKLWRLWPDDLMAEACARLSRNLTPHEWRTYIGDEPYQRTCNNLP